MAPTLRALGPRIALVVALTSGLACASAPPPPVGSVSDPQASGPADPGATGDPAAQAQKTSGGGLQQHAESGVESMIIGTVVGGQIMGAYGAAVGAALFGLYGFITGDVPFETGAGTRGPPGRGRAPGGGPGPDSVLDQELEDELSRQDALEDEIESELKRQEELLASISKHEEINASVQREQQARAVESSSDPMAAPRPPYERKLPDSIFDTTRSKEGRKERITKTLDADRDGRPELEMVFDADSGELMTRSEDTNYDGVLDAVHRYEGGVVVERIEDTNHDGKPDRWTTYENEVGTRAEVDRNFDGIPDAFYVYESGRLSYEEHDTNQDGKVDRRVEFENGKRAVEIEDRNHNGKMDFWTFYDADGIPVRTQQDVNEDGQPETWEFYEGDDPSRIVLTRKEEDVNADGKVDIISYYKKGKLARKEVSDPDLLLQ